MAEQLTLNPTQIETPRDPGVAFEPVTPNDDTLIPRTRALYVGTAGGDLTFLPVMKVDGSPATDVRTIPNAPVGYHPIQCVKVMDTGTDVSDIVAVY